MRNPERRYGAEVVIRVSCRRTCPSCDNIQYEFRMAPLNDPSNHAFSMVVNVLILSEFNGDANIRWRLLLGHSRDLQKRFKIVAVVNQEWSAVRIACARGTSDIQD